MFELADETLCVLDYKTDSVPLDHAEAAKMLAERYKTQLEYYSAACEIITGKRVSKKIIWSFALGMAIEL
jgi:ATP-dependent helicase/nuclease subunit A